MRLSCLKLGPNGTTYSSSESTFVVSFVYLCVVMMMILMMMMMILMMMMMILMMILMILMMMMMMMFYDRSPSLCNMQCMLQTGPNVLIMGGHQPLLVSFDLETRQEIQQVGNGAGQ